MKEYQQICIILDKKKKEIIIKRSKTTLNKNIVLKNIFKPFLKSNIVKFVLKFQVSKMKTKEFPKQKLQK